MAEVIVENSHNCEMAIGKDYVYGPEGYIVWDKVGGIELKAGVNRIKVKNDLIKRGFRFVRNADTVKSVAFENLSKDMIESMNGLFMGCEDLECVDFFRFGFF